MAPDLPELELHRRWAAAAPAPPRSNGCGRTWPQATTVCVLAYWHHPLFSSGRYSPGIATVRPLFQALYDYNADVLLTGHDHNYERFAPQDPNGVFNEARGIREFVVGTGGHSQYAQGAPIPNSEVRNSGSYGVRD